MFCEQRFLSDHSARGVFSGDVLEIAMENPAKKARIDNEEDAGAKGAQATIETAVELEHEDGAEAAEQEAVEQQEFAEEELDAEEVEQQEELNTAMAALEDVQERIRGVSVSLIVMSYFPTVMCCTS